MESYCQTDVGLKRNNNQDFVYASDQMVGALSCLWIVADGMGGHAAGDIASRLCVETMIDTISNSKQEGPVRILAEAIRSANEVVCEKARSTPDLEGMGTPVVAATGLYLIDDERIEQITHDHSLVEEMVRAGRIRADQARNHPKKNIITRAIGEEGVPEIDFFDVALNPGDILLLCSDGLSNMVEDEQIFRIVRREADLHSAGQRLIEAANKAGGTDNISVVLAKP